MKKYLMTAIAAVAMGAAFTSCSHNDDLYNNGEENNKQNEQYQIDLAESEYAAVFEKAFGKVGANVDWGFSSGAGTRAVIKTDMTNYPKTGNPAAITQKEAEFVTNWFQNNPGLSEEGKPWKNFYVQFVSGDQTNKKGIWHRYDQNRINNGYDSNYWDEEFTENGGMDKLHVGATQDQNATDHINDFNAKTGGPWDVAYVENGSAMQWGYHSSWGEDSKAPKGDGYYWYFKMAEIEVPGYCFEDGKARVGCYVGLSLYGKKYDNGDKELGYQRLQYAEDWILKVTNADKPLYRVIAEDLSAESSSDFDFNDVVFDVVKYDESTQKTTLRLQACGGILPLKVGSTNGVGGVEVHELYGDTPDAKGNYKMWNTGLNSHDPVPFEINGEYTTPEQLNNLSIEVQKNGTWMPLTARRGVAACKILVDDRFGIVPERQSIANKYGNFTTYVQGNWKSDDEQFWWIQQ